MGLNDSALNVMAAALADDIDQVGLATGDPGAGGTSNATTHPKEAVTWTAASAGDISSSADILFEGGAANGAVVNVTFWSGSTYRGFKALTGGSTSNALGEYRIPAGDLDINGFSTA